MVPFSILAWKEPTVTQDILRYLYRNVKAGVIVIKVFVIAPYHGLGQLIKETALAFPNIEVHVEEGNLEAGIDLAKHAEAEGYSAILSRGGTGELVAPLISLPVYNIPVSGYDVLRSISLARNYKGGKAVVGFEDITTGYREVNSLLDVGIEIITIHHRSEIDDVLHNLQQKGVKTIIGDMLATEHARLLGMNTMLITSGKESVTDALTQLQSHMATIGRYQEQTNVLKDAIRDKLPTVAAMLFDDGQFIYYNEKLGNDIPDLYNRIKNAFQSLGADEIVRDFVFEVNDISYHLAAQRINSGSGVSYCIFNIIALETAAPDGINIYHPQDIDALSYTVYESGIAQLLTNQTRNGSSTALPLLIEGDAGTGKHSLALLLQRQFSGGKRNVVSIKCDEITVEGIRSAMELYQVHGVNTDRIPFVLKRLECLTIEKQKALLSYKGSFSSFRFIATSRLGIQDLIHSGVLLQELADAFGFISVSVPPLRHHIEDLENILSIFIAQENEFLGKQVVSLSEGALEIAKKHEWRGNLAELRQVVNEAVHLAHEPVVDATMLQTLLSRSPERSMQISDLCEGKTLEEFEREVILSVLKAENMNQRKTASRLGISRTTLWRKIKFEEA